MAILEASSPVTAHAAAYFNAATPQTSKEQRQHRQAQRIQRIPLSLALPQAPQFLFLLTS
eukprot:2708957-Amphidinium_carterae.1